VPLGRNFMTAVNCSEWTQVGLGRQRLNDS